MTKLENVVFGNEYRPELDAKANRNLKENWDLLCRDLGEPVIIDNALLGASHRLRAFWVLQGHGDLPGGARPVDIPVPDRRRDAKTWQECLDPGRRPPRALEGEQPPMAGRNSRGQPCQACWTLMKTINTYSEMPRKFRSAEDRTSSNRVFSRPYTITGNWDKDLESDRVGDHRMNARERERCCGLPDDQTAAPGATEADRAGGLGNSIMADTYKYILDFLPRKPPAETGVAVRTRDPDSTPKTEAAWRATQWTPTRQNLSGGAAEPRAPQAPPPAAPTPPPPSSDTSALTAYERERQQKIARNRSELGRLFSQPTAQRGEAATTLTQIITPENQTASKRKKKAEAPKQKKTQKGATEIFPRIGERRPEDLANARAIVDIFRLAPGRPSPCVPRNVGPRIKLLSRASPVLSRGALPKHLGHYLSKRQLKYRGTASPWSFYNREQQALRKATGAATKSQDSKHLGSAGCRPGLRSNGPKDHVALPNTTARGGAKRELDSGEPNASPPKKKFQEGLSTASGTLSAPPLKALTPRDARGQPPPPKAAPYTQQAHNGSEQMRMTRAMRIATARAEGTLQQPEVKEGPLPREGPGKKPRARRGGATEPPAPKRQRLAAPAQPEHAAAQRPSSPARAAHAVLDAAAQARTRAALEGEGA